MTRGRMLKIVNAAIGILFVTQASSGFLMDEIGEKAFEVIHVGGGTVLVLCATVHVWLNWGWIRTSYFRHQG